jgi:hypothetical protein
MNANGVSMSTTQTGCVQACSLLIDVTPKNTIGMITSEQMRYPATSLSPRANCSAWAQIEVSIAKNTKVNAA